MNQVTKSPWAPRVLPVAALFGPLWPTWIGVQQVQVGRILVLLVAGAAVIDVVTRRTGPLRPRWATVVLLIGAIGLAVWNAISASVWGCVCGGTVQGMADTALLLAVASFVMLYARPRDAALALGAAALGALLGGVAAAIGLQDLHANTFDPSESGSRLEGVYGNPNFLGFALALAVPITVAASARVTGWKRIAPIIATVLLGGLLLATFSRGSLLAAGVGGAAALLAAVPALRRWRVVGPAAVLVPALLIGFIASPLYRDQRVQADFGKERADVDHSGWSAGAIGPVDTVGATLSNPPSTSAMRVTATRTGQGATYPLNRPLTAGRWPWRLTLSAPQGAERARFHWQVNRYDGSVLAEGQMAVRRGTPTYVRNFTVTTHATDWLLFSTWTDRPTTFQIEALRTTGQEPEPSRPRYIPTKLLGMGTGALHSAEDAYIDSRQTALRLAVTAFGTHPVRGIGANEFPLFADRRATFGPLPTHNTYAQVAAELGLIGLALLALLAAGLLGAGMRGGGDALVRAAAIGTATAGAAGLVFINGLSSAGMLMPLLIAMATLTGWAGDRPRATLDPSAGSDT